jgi:hypothetical protein
VKPCFIRRRDGQDKNETTIRLDSKCLSSRANSPTSNFLQANFGQQPNNIEHPRIPNTTQHNHTSCLQTRFSAKVSSRTCNAKLMKTLLSKMYVATDNFWKLNGTADELTFIIGNP